jgi:glycine betaine/proline transport system substrate-binding protein
MSRLSNVISALSVIIGTLLAGPSHAAEPATCKQVNFGLMPWTDLIFTTTSATIVLQRLGYTTQQTNAAESMIATSLKSNRVDAFVGYWKPAADETFKPLIDSGSISIGPAPNLADGQMMLAVPKYMADQGLRSVSDLARFKDQLDGKIYGIDAGTGINRQISDLIKTDRFNLQGFTLVASSEAGMLSAVSKAVAQKKGVVFIAWKPHPMNLRMDLWYLTGSEGTMGPNDGAATVWSLTRMSYPRDCPNADRFINNLRFTSAEESEMMAKILDQHIPADKVAQEFVHSHPDVVRGWLAGVTTFDGGNAEKAVFAKP